MFIMNEIKRHETINWKLRFYLKIKKNNQFHYFKQKNKHQQL